MTQGPGASLEVTPSAEPPTPAVVAYKVVSGDTLSGLAARYGTTVKAIMDANGLTSTVLRIGQPLTIPLPAAQPTGSRTASPTVTPS